MELYIHFTVCFHGVYRDNFGLSYYGHLTKGVGEKWEEVTGGKEKVHNEELWNLYSS